MKKSTGFLESLEKYSWKAIGRSPLPQYWPWIGVALVIMIILASVVNKPGSVVGAESVREIIELAAGRGDYQTARDLLNHYTNKPMNNLVLGAESELEDKVYPERVVERRIAELETKLEEYPENKEVYLMLSSLYGQLGYSDTASEYREKARILDPNGVEFK